MTSYNANEIVEHLGKIRINAEKQIDFLLSSGSQVIYKIRVISEYGIDDLTKIYHFLKSTNFVYRLSINQDGQIELF